MGAEAAPVAVDDLWELAARPGVLGRAALAWRAVAVDARIALDAFDRAAAPVVGGDWEGEAAEGYRAHAGRLGESLEQAARAAEETATALDGAAALLRAGQDQLDTAWERVAAAVPGRRGGGAVTFRPTDAAQAAAVRAAIAAAAAIREDVERGLARYEGLLGARQSDWELLGSEWAAVATGRIPAWTPPAEAGGIDARLVGGLFVVQTGAGADEVVVGDGHVVVDGERIAIPAGARLVLRTGAGDDTVRADAGPGGAGVTVLAGDGSDRLFGGAGDDVLIAGAGLDAVVAGGGDDRVSLGATAKAGGVERADLGDGDDRLWGSLGDEADAGGAGDDLLFAGAGADHLAGGAGADTLGGGAGRDYLDGGAGDDRLDGGGGTDTLYGLGGADALRGGDGADYLEGGAGDDRLDGGTGADVVSGGRGDDAIDGGSGDDTLYSGEGRDAVTGGAGVDRLLGQAADTATGVERLTAAPAGGDLAGFVTVEGDPAYQARVRADLELLAASPDGRRMLEELRASGEPLRIVPTGENNGWANPGDGQPFIRYNPEYDTMLTDTPPVVVLFHELAHAWDFVHDTSAGGTYDGGSGSDHFADGSAVPNTERQAAGLPIDDDGDPATPERIDPDHPLELTENGLRAEMGLRHRDRYAYD
ncbi:M91 family zinc metallopeptidase [Dactylosporangium sp. CA-092794]|uniref:M91 family zinc metallopeptidase n=1 Tax=Dactylosporangium sp. CA-092794 TaxID=3239929 RepID=UPI003D8BA414